MKKQEVLVMNNIKYILLACCMHVGLYSQEVGSDSWVQNEARRLGNKKISEITQADLPKEHADLVIRELRKRPEKALLIRLRDERTINEILNRYIELEGRTEFLKRRMADSRSPWLLPLLAPILVENPVFERRIYGDHGDDFGYPHTTADLMRDIIHKSPEFSDEVRESFAYKGEDPWLLAGMRRWWAENADAVNNEKYLEVKAFDHSDLMKRSPLELYGLDPASKPESTNEPSPTPGISTTPTQHSEINSKQREGEETLPKQDRQKIIYIIAGGALFAGFIFYATNKRK